MDKDDGGRIGDKPQRAHGLDGWRKACVIAFARRQQLKHIMPAVAYQGAYRRVDAGSIVKHIDHQACEESDEQYQEFWRFKRQEQDKEYVRKQDHIGSQVNILHDEYLQEYQQYKADAISDHLIYHFVPGILVQDCHAPLFCCNGSRRYGLLF